MLVQMMSSGYGAFLIDVKYYLLSYNILKLRLLSQQAPEILFKSLEL